MLSDDNVRMINVMIAKELREADRFVTSDDEKLAALERVAKLQTLLEKQITPQVNMDQLADKIIEKMSKPSDPEPHPLSVLIDAFINRR